MVAMYKDRAALFFGLLYKTDRCADDILFDDILDVIFGPFICKKIDAGEFGTVLTMFTRAINDMCDLIHL